MPKPSHSYNSAVVTGGTRGIGYAIAEALLKRDTGVLICGTNQTGIDRALGSLKASHPDRIAGIVCDVRDHGQVQAMMREAENRFGGLDILVNNAGIGRFASLEEMSPDDWRATIETNLSGLFYCCREVIPLMKKRGGGYIFNIGSLAGRNYFPRGSAYGASKAGLIALSESLMQEVRYDHIRVSYVMPGSVETEFGGPAASPRHTKKTWKLLPEDVAQVIVDLLDSDPRSLQSRVELRPSEPSK